VATIDLRRTALLTEQWHTASPQWHASNADAAKGEKMNQNVKVNRWVLGLLLPIAGMPWAARVRAGITVVNTIPQDLSNESDQNSEPNIAVNPNDTSKLVVSAFRFSTPAGSPYFVSSGLNSVLWSSAATQKIAHGDTTLDWSRGGTFYTTVLTNNGATIDVRKSNNKANGVAFTPIPGSAYTPGGGNIPDQPWIVVDNVAPLLDHIYVGFNDLSKTPQSASVHYSLDSGASWNATNGGIPLVIDRINHGAAPGFLQDGPPVRLDYARNGTRVYAAFVAWMGFAVKPLNKDQNAQIIVVRDNLGGSNNFMDLNGGIGVNIFGGATTVRIPMSLDGIGTGTSLGQERLGSDLSIAVDPTNSDRVYVAYADVPIGGTVPQVHIMFTLDGGLTWSLPRSVEMNTALPAVAVAQNGKIGLLYTALTGGRFPKLETHFSQITQNDILDPNNFETLRTNEVLSSFRNNDPRSQFDPYIGDYQDVEAIGNDFYGTFSASNRPDPANFPAAAAVIYQRNVRFGANVFGPAGPFDVKVEGVGTLDDDTPANGSPGVSIDPFFFTTAAVQLPPAGPPLTVVPAISPWAAATLALLSLVGIAIKFGRRRAVT